MTAPKQPALDLTIFVTCYNERDLITQTIETVRKTMAAYPWSYEVIIVDDRSRDDSVKVIREYLAHEGLEQQFKLVANEVNRGIGINYFTAAAMGRGEYFLIVHGDNAVPVESVHGILNLLGKADVIVPYYGTRLFSKKFNCDHRTFMRRFLSRVFGCLVRLLSRHELRYFNGLVLHRRDNVLRYRVSAYGLSYQAELLCKMLNNPRISYLEVKVHNFDRTHGPTSAFKLRNIVSVMGSLWRIFLGSFRQNEPEATAEPTPSSASSR